MYKLREYQEIAVSKGLEVLLDKKGRKEVLVGCTASGKSLLVAEISRRLLDGNTLVLQPSEELLIQNLEKIESFGVFPAVYSASLKRKELDKNIIYATPKSINFEVLKDANIKYVLFDECDFSSKPDSHIVETLKKLKIESVLGLTGSPIYLSQTAEGAEVKIMTSVRGSFFKNICHVIQIQEMVQSGYWSDIQYYNIDSSKTQKYLKLNSNGSEYTDESKETFYEKSGLQDKISTFLKRLPVGENALVFVPSIEYADDLCKLIPNSVSIHSKTNKKLRKQYVDDFKNDKIDIVVTPLALLTGFDKPNLLNIVDASPSNSLRVKIQKDGRGVRIHENKKMCRIIDFAGNYDRFGDVRNLTIENIPNYGWGIFNGDKLLTGVPINSKMETTKEYLIKNGKPNITYVFGSHNPGDAKIDFGKFKGQTVKDIYKKRRHYLKWLAESTDFFFKDKELERQIKSIWE